MVMHPLVGKCILRLRFKPRFPVVIMPSIFGLYLVFIGAKCGENVSCNVKRETRNAENLDVVRLFGTY